MDGWREKEKREDFLKSQFIPSSKTSHIAQLELNDQVGEKRLPPKTKSMHACLDEVM